MIKLKDGRDELWQWDTCREVSIDAECSQVHFGRGVYGRTIDVDVVDGNAKIPDILLQSADDLHCYGYVGSDADGYTKIEKVFKVNKRKKPADYVFTEQDQRTLEQIIKRVELLEETQDPDAIKKAVEDYLKNNPIHVEETDPTVPEWAKKPTKPTYTAEEVGALPDYIKIPAPYELPIATADSLGGVKAIPATDAMTEYVGIDADGKLKVPLANAGGGSGSTWRKIRTVTIPEDITTDTSGVAFAERTNGGAIFAFDTDENGQPFEVTEIVITGYISKSGGNGGFGLGTLTVPQYGLGWITANLELGSSGKKVYSWCYASLLEGDVVLDYRSCFGGGGANNVTSSGRILKYTNYGITSFKSFHAYIGNAGYYGFEAGSTFTFYGR